MPPEGCHFCGKSEGRMHYLANTPLKPGCLSVCDACLPAYQAGAMQRDLDNEFWSPLLKSLAFMIGCVGIGVLVWVTNGWHP
jgi:hypothetical protein